LTFIPDSLENAAIFWLRSSVAWNFFSYKCTYKHRIFRKHSTFQFENITKIFQKDSIFAKKMVERNRDWMIRGNLIKIVAILPKTILKRKQPPY